VETETSPILKLLHVLGIWAFLVLLMSCGLGNDSVKNTAPEYDGVGLHQSSPQLTVVSGKVKFKAFSSGEIKVEARRSVPCKYGRCPVIGEPSLAEQELGAPGDYSLQLSQSAKDLMVIATLSLPDGKTRVAHSWLLSEAPEVPGVDLSLDRPYPPLR